MIYRYLVFMGFMVKGGYHGVPISNSFFGEPGRRTEPREPSHFLFAQLQDREVECVVVALAKIACGPAEALGQLRLPSKAVPEELVLDKTLDSYFGFELQDLWLMRLITSSNCSSWGF